MQKNWLKCLSRFCLGAIAALLSYLYTGQTEPRFLLMVCLLLFPAAGTIFLEEKADAPLVFYAGELLLLLVTVLPNIFFAGMDILAGGLVIVIPSVLSASGTRRNLLDRLVAAEGMLFLTAYLWAVWNEAGYLYQLFLYVLSVSFLLLYFYQKNQHGRQLFLEAAGSVAKEQETDVKQVNRRSLLPFLLLVLLLSVLVWIPIGSQALTEFLQKQYSGAMEVIQEWMMEIPEDFAGMFGEPEEETKEEESETEQNGGEPLPTPIEEEPTLWLLKALIQGVMFFLTLLAAGGLFLLLRRAAEKREHISQNEMQQEYELTITEKSTRLERKRFRRQTISDSVAENRRIRQLYRELIRRGLIKKSDNSYQAMTPEELEFQAGLWAGHGQRQSDLEIIHRIYEKARYGREACTKEEQRQAEEAVKRGFL